MLPMLKTIGSFLFKPKNLFRTSLATLASLGTTAINLGGPYFLVESLNLIRDEEESTKEDDIYLMMSLYASAWSLGKITPLLRNILLSRINADLSHDLTRRVITQYYQMPFEMRAERGATPELQHYSNSYMRIGEHFIGTFYGEFIPTVFEILALGAMLTYLDPYIGAGSAGIIVFYAIVASVGSKYVAHYQNLRISAAFLGTSAILKRLDQYESAHYYNNIPFELKQLDQALEPFDNAINKNILVRNTAASTQAVVIGLGYSATILFATYSVINERSTKELFWIILYMTQFSVNLDLFSNALNKLQEANSYFVKLFEYLNQDHIFKDDSSKDDLTFSTKQSSIEFKEVGLRYKDRNNDALTNISFNISPGKTVGLVGKSGSGKSSVLNLICGFYNATQGQVFINGQDLTRVNRQSISSAIAVIPQNGYFINDTLYNNVQYAAMDATPEQIRQAISDASLIPLSEELQQDTIGENGKKLSGGQKQRISIARAILRIMQGAAILIADEPTSALDEQTSIQIIQQIYTLVKKMAVTALIVTHDFKIIADETLVDEIIVVDSGQLVDRGKISQLMTRNGLFSQQLQQAKAAISERTEEEKIPLKKEGELSNSIYRFSPPKKPVIRSIQGDPQHDEYSNEDSHTPLLRGMRSDE